MSEIPNLDPDSKEATKRLNRFFCEENESIEDLSKQELLWYLRTVLLWYEELSIVKTGKVGDV